MRRWARVSALAAAGALTVSLAAACSSSSQSSAPQGQTCFKQVTDAQRAELQTYVAAHPGATTTTKGKDVCVLTPNGHGGYTAQYYGPNDGFQWYPLYVVMSNSAQHDAHYGQLKGQLTTAERVTFANLTEVYPDGSVTQPYTLKSGAYERTNTVVKPIKVNAVRYGTSSEEESPAKAFTNPSKGYSVSTLPNSSNEEGTEEGGSFHVTQLKPNEGGYQAPEEQAPVHEAPPEQAPVHEAPPPEEAPVHVGGEE